MNKESFAAMATAASPTATSASNSDARDADALWCRCLLLQGVLQLLLDRKAFTIKLCREGIASVIVDRLFAVFTANNSNYSGYMAATAARITPQQFTDAIVQLILWLQPATATAAAAAVIDLSSNITTDADRVAYSQVLRNIWLPYALLCKNQGQQQQQSLLQQQQQQQQRQQQQSQLTLNVVIDDDDTCAQMPSLTADRVASVEALYALRLNCGGNSISEFRCPLPVSATAYTSLTLLRTATVIISQQERSSSNDNSSSSSIEQNEVNEVHVIDGIFSRVRMATRSSTPTAAAAVLPTFVASAATAAAAATEEVSMIVPAAVPAAVDFVDLCGSDDDDTSDDDDDDDGDEEEETCDIEVAAATAAVPVEAQMSENEDANITAATAAAAAAEALVTKASRIIGESDAGDDFAAAAAAAVDDGHSETSSDDQDMDDDVPLMSRSQIDNSKSSSDSNNSSSNRNITGNTINDNNNKSDDTDNSSDTKVTHKSGASSSSNRYESSLTSKSESKSSNKSDSSSSSSSAVESKRRRFTVLEDAVLYLVFNDSQLEVSQRCGVTAKLLQRTPAIVRQHYHVLTDKAEFKPSTALRQEAAVLIAKANKKGRPIAIESLEAPSAATAATTTTATKAEKMASTPAAQAPAASAHSSATDSIAQKRPAALTAEHDEGNSKRSKNNGSSQFNDQSSGNIDATASAAESAATANYSWVFSLTLSSLSELEAKAHPQYTQQVQQQQQQSLLMLQEWSNAASPSLLYISKSCKSAVLDVSLTAVLRLSSQMQRGRGWHTLTQWLMKSERANDADCALVLLRSIERLLQWQHTHGDSTREAQQQPELLPLLRQWIVSSNNFTRHHLHVRRTAREILSKFRPVS